MIKKNLVRSILTNTFLLSRKKDLKNFRNLILTMTFSMNQKEKLKIIL